MKNSGHSYSECGSYEPEILKLTAENVIMICNSCICTDKAVTNVINAQGVRLNLDFDPIKLVKNERSIREMLHQLPKEFRASSGGGASFLDMALDENGTLWGEHYHVDALLCLGLAIEKLTFTLPRDKWWKFPQSMPYITYHD